MALQALINLSMYLVKLLFNQLVPQLIIYSIVSLIYLSLYDSLGFEKTIILLLVGVVVFALRGNSGHTKSTVA